MPTLPMPNDTDLDVLPPRPPSGAARSTGTVQVPLPELGVIAVSGADAVAFLQSQLTNDVAHLTPGQMQLSGYCTAKGRLLATFHQWRTRRRRDAAAAARDPARRAEAPVDVRAAREGEARRRERRMGTQAVLGATSPAARARRRGIAASPWSGIGRRRRAHRPRAGRRGRARSLPADRARRRVAARVVRRAAARAGGRVVVERDRSRRCRPCSPPRRRSSCRR